MASDSSHSQEVDLERTDRLPVLDGTVFDADVEDDAVRMDFTPAAPSVKAEFQRPSGVDLPSLAESVRTVEERIAKQNVEYENLSRAYDKVRDAEITAVSRSHALAADVASLRSLLETEQARTRQLDKSLADNNAAVEATRARIEEALRDAERNQSEARTLRDTLVTRDAAIAEVLHSLGERDAQLSALQREHAQLVPVLEERGRTATKLDAELRAARARADAIAAELQESKASVATLTAKMHTGDRELDATRHGLAAMKTQATSYLERLRTHEWRLGFDQNLFRELDAKIGAAHDDRGQMQSERDQLRRHLAEAESKLAVRDESIAKLQAAAMDDEALRVRHELKLQQAEDSRTELMQKISALEGERTRLGGELEAREQSITAFESAAAEADTALAERDFTFQRVERTCAELSGKLAELERERKRLEGELAVREQSIAALKSAAAEAEAGRAERDFMLQRVERTCAELNGKLAELESAHARLDGELQAREQSIAALKSAATEADMVRAEREFVFQNMEHARAELSGKITELESERVRLNEAMTAKDREIADAKDAVKGETQRSKDQMAAADTDRTALRAEAEHFRGEVRAREQELAVLTAQLKEARRPVEPLEADIKRLTDEVAARATAYSQLQDDNRKLNASLERARGALEEREFLIRRLERNESNNANVLGRIQTSIERLGTAAAGPSSTAAPMECTAELVRLDGEHRTAHLLGRRTRLGRAPGCEIQIDSSSVSRHHALLLMGAREIIIEDLNSTNGVLVNGRKVSRQLLEDGDVLTIGEAQFRLSQKLSQRVLESPSSTSAASSGPSAPPA